jgi:protein gp37
MGADTKIEWTDASWTPIRARHKGTGRVGWHCEHVTPGCEHCYAEEMNKRLGTHMLFKPGYRKNIEIFLDEEMLMAPLRWKKPRMIFVCSMTDLFADFVTDEWIDKVYAVMALCPQHTFQVLTKRSRRMREYMSSLSERRIDNASRPFFARFDNRRVYDLPLPNVWLGVSTEDQQRADERIPDLLCTPAAIRFVSAEPLLGPIDFTSIRQTAAPGYFGDALQWYHRGKSHDDEGLIYPLLDWIIVGGESGPAARPMHPDWLRSIRDKCAAAGTAFFFKQWGEYWPAEIVRKGEDGEWWRRFPQGARRLFTECGTENPPAVYFSKLGKKLAGRLLDGIEHNAMPELRK